MSAGRQPPVGRDHDGAGLRLGVLGPLSAWDAAGDELRLPGARHRELLARLVVARGRVVGVDTLAADLWDDPGPGSLSAVRTFVAALRRVLEPARAPRTPPHLLLTVGPGYALRLPESALDAMAFERDVAAARALPPPGAQQQLTRALATWRGPALVDVGDRPWARGEAARLEALRLQAVEDLADARLESGDHRAAVPDLEAHTREHPWREHGWRLLALALYRDGRQRDALAVLRRARRLLAEQVGVQPGPALAALERDVLHHDVPAPLAGTDVAGTWSRAAAAYDLAVAPTSRAHLRATGELLRVLATTGGAGLRTAREQRTTLVRAAEAVGDGELLARLVGEHDVPALWTRPDDPGQAQHLVTLAEQALDALGAQGSPSLRARLLATVAVETRGTGGEAAARGAAAARQAEALARELGDPVLLVHALNATYLHSFTRPGLAARRAAIGAELVEVSARHDLPAHEILGHLVLAQARAALGDVDGADRAAAAADDLGHRFEAPLVTVFTRWHTAVRAALVGEPPHLVETAARAAADGVPPDAMPGVADGLLPLVVLCARVPSGTVSADGWADLDPGPYAPWIRPWTLLAAGRRDDAARLLARAPAPPPGHLLDACWALTAELSLVLDDFRTAHRARRALAPAADEVAGAGSGIVALGGVDDLLRRLDDLA